MTNATPGAWCGFHSSRVKLSVPRRRRPPDRLEAAGDKKIQVIKEVRSLTSLGLKEAKDLVDGAPQPVLERVNKESADKAKAALEGAGATVTVK